MKTQYGFSLTDILVALILLSSVSLILFKQYWVVLQYMQQLRLRNLAIIELDNITESWLAGERVDDIRKPFKLAWLDSKTVELTWVNPGSSSEQSIRRLL